MARSDRRVVLGGHRLIERLVVEPILVLRSGGSMRRVRGISLEPELTALPSATTTGNHGLPTHQCNDKLNRVSSNGARAQ